MAGVCIRQASVGGQAGDVMMSKDAREGPRAFKERRTPEFKGE